MGMPGAHALYNGSSERFLLDQQITYIKKGLAELIREEDLRERIASEAGKPLRVKTGR